MEDAVSVQWDAVTGAKTYVVRWGESFEGLLDDNMELVVAPDVDIVIGNNIPAVGKDIDVYVMAFDTVYTTAAEAMESQEYDPNNWSDLVTATIKAKPAPAPKARVAKVKEPVVEP